MTWDLILVASTFVAAIGCGLIAGAFFAFSTFVMKALGRLPAAEGMAAMQGINIVVINPMFLGVFLGTAVIAGLAAVAAVVRGERPGAGWVLAGAALYLIGTFGVTMACNVPLNNSLAATTPADPAAPQRWGMYLKRWTMWNHVRTAAALLAAIALVLALRRGV